MRKFIFAGLLSLLSIGIGWSQNNKIFEVEPSLEQDLALLEAYPYTFENIDTESLGLDSIVKSYNLDNFDPDSLVQVITHKVIGYLKNTKSDEIDWSTFPRVTEIEDKTGTLHVLNFAYSSGGTAGMIPNPIIIRERADSLQIFDMTDTGCDYFQFYHLYGDTFLCAGYSPGWSLVYVLEVAVIDFSGDTARFEPAFGADFPTHYQAYNAYLVYNPLARLLTIDIQNDPPGYENSDCQSYFQKEIAGCFDVECFNDTTYTFAITATLKTRFDGKKFVKPNIQF